MPRSVKINARNLARFEKLVNAGFREKPRWLAAVKASPPIPPRHEHGPKFKLRTITFLEDDLRRKYVEEFGRSEPYNLKENCEKDLSKKRYLSTPRMNAFIQRQMQLMEGDLSEEESFAQLAAEYRAEIKASEGNTNLFGGNSASSSPSGLKWEETEREAGSVDNFQQLLKILKGKAMRKPSSNEHVEEVSRLSEKNGTKSDKDQK